VCIACLECLSDTIGLETLLSISEFGKYCYYMAICDVLMFVVWSCCCQVVDVCAGARVVCPVKIRVGQPL